MTVAEYAAVAGVAQKNVLAWINVGLRGVGKLAARKVAPRGGARQYGYSYEVSAKAGAAFLAKRNALRAQRTANEQARARRALGVT